ncbi:hypothetical protein F2Q69_00015533 [Brassica cretica]|uniref:Uncharacterized protein n=1 Tax=Brassica cretica TaxID=69181 RepID=A0A8S9R189_BRACR|nr:hypothetical protein F2Q69_00015533 [Brassica cretica]
MDLRDVVRSWRLMARNCSGTSEIGTVQFLGEVFTMKVSSFKLFLEPMIAYNVLFNLLCSLYDFRCALFLEDVHETIHEGINLGEDINVSIVRDTSCAKSSFLSLDVHETIHEGINLGEDINVSIVRDTSCAKSSFLSLGMRYSVPI